MVHSEVRNDLEIYDHRYIVFGVVFKKSANTFGVIAIPPRINPGILQIAYVSISVV
jgi:hypothetical protein